MAFAGLSASVTYAVIWAILATAVAFLPVGRQYWPGVVLMAAAPIVIALLGVQHGWLPALGGLAAFFSMFRKPLRYYWRKVRGISQ